MTPDVLYLASLPVAMIAAGRDGVVRFLNPSAEALLDTSLARSTGKPLTQLIDAEDRVHQLLERVTGGGEHIAEYGHRLCRVHGDPVAVHLHLAPVAAGGSITEAVILLDRPLLPHVPMHRETRDVAAEPQDLVGTSAAMQEIYRALAKLVDVDLTLLLCGESGTGKEMAARTLHALGRRKSAPFVAVNLAAIPRESIESELFGHEKGAFTGAATRRIGRFEQASGGTIFLDEIGDMPQEAQTRLLRVLQEGEYTPVGGAKPHRVNLRVVAATHRDLKEMVRRGEFREDLYYRINVVPLRLPPLRERTEDIPALAAHFLELAARRGLGRKSLDESAMEALKAHSWPGNVRELQNLMYRMCALRPESLLGRQAVGDALGDQARPVTGGSLQDAVRGHLERYFAAHTDGAPPPGLYDRILRVVERPLIEATLNATGGNQLKAAAILGINRNTLRKKIAELGVVARIREE